MPSWVFWCRWKLNWLALQAQNVGIAYVIGKFINYWFGCVREERAYSPHSLDNGSHRWPILDHITPAGGHQIFDFLWTSFQQWRAAAWSPPKTQKGQRKSPTIDAEIPKRVLKHAKTRQAPERRAPEIFQEKTRASSTFVNGPHHAERRLNRFEWLLSRQHFPQYYAPAEHITLFRVLGSFEYFCNEQQN